MPVNNVSKLEALLFTQGSEMKKKDVMRLLNMSFDELRSTIQTLSRSCSGRGIVLAETELTVALRSAPEHAAFLAEIHKDSLKGDLGKAGLEILSILLYKGDSTRAEIDFIRGVNSSFIIRHLMMRGIIERIKGDSTRQFIYQPTIQALSVLGVTEKTNLSEYDTIHNELIELENNKQGNNS